MLAANGISFFPYPSRYAVRYEGESPYAAMDFARQIKKRPLAELLSMQLLPYEILEIDDGIRPYCFLVERLGHVRCIRFKSDIARESKYEESGGKAFMGLGAAKAADSTATAKATPGNTFAGGLSGMVSRHVQQSTASSISGQSGGIGTSLGCAMYHNSLGKDGGFASKVIGSIATGQTSGSITGDSAVEALNGYFSGTSDADAMPIPATGENIPTAMATAENDAVIDSPIPATPLALEGDSTVDVSPTRDSEIALRAGGSAIVEQTTIPTSSSIQQAAMNRVLLGQMGNSVTDVEIGGGKIQGREIIPGRGQIQFAMYNARRYEKPEGHFTEQTSRDSEKWYKVYATTRVEKTPTVQDERGRMQYDERKVAAMPKAPARRH